MAKLFSIYNPSYIDTSIELSNEKSLFEIRQTILNIHLSIYLWLCLANSGNNVIYLVIYRFDIIKFVYSNMIVLIQITQSCIIEVIIDIILPDLAQF